jgi:hypothetical protein
MSFMTKKVVSAQAYAKSRVKTVMVIGLRNLLVCETFMDVI